MSWYPTSDIDPSWKDSYLKTYFQGSLLPSSEPCLPSVTWGAETSVTVLAEYTPDEWQKLLDCILQGAIIIYPNDYHAIWWSFVKQLDCPMSICTAFIECLENDPATREAVQQTITGGIDIAGTPYYWLQDAIPPVSACDKDKTWGYAKAFWGYIDSKNKDFLEQLALATNVGQQLETMISAIPLFGLLPFDEISGWVADLGDYNLEAYNSSITVEITTQIECDLFCLAVDNNCHLTFDMVWDYILAKFGGFNFPTLGATFAELIFFMVTGVYPNDRIVYLWTLVQLGIAFIGGEFLGSNQLNLYRLYAQAGDPDNDWSILCDVCGWTSSWLDGNGNPLLNVWTKLLGTYNAVDLDMDSEYNGTSSQLVYLIWDVTADVTITEIFQESTLYKNNTTNRAQQIRHFDFATQITTVLATVDKSASGTQTYSLMWNGSLDLKVGDQINLWNSVSVTGGSTTTMNQLRVNGTGVSPF